MARPALPPAFVARRRLMDRLDEGVRGEVTLLSAGPGSGKTVLAAAWAESGGAPGPVAWLSLDGYDNSPAAFWSYVIGALRSTGAVPDDNPLASIRPGPRVDDSYVRRIANGIARLPGPVVLVLEDLHEIDNPQVLKSLAFLLRHPVPQLRLVVTTRMDPALPLHRLRSRGGLVEIRAPDWPSTPTRRPSCSRATTFRSPPPSWRSCSIGPRAGPPASDWPRCSCVSAARGRG